METSTYAWVSPGSLHKYNRAKVVLKKEGKEVSEANIKELYIKYGGLVLEVDVPAVEEAAKEEASEEEKPIVRRRPTLS